MQQKGYTLIELLLVIAVLAILTSLAITAYHRNAETNRSEQVALEMQQVLQAALTFNVAKNNWPDKNDITPACIPNAHDDFVLNFLPNANVVSHYGNNFCWGPDTNVTTPNSPLFWVALKMPFTDSTRNYQVGTQIAAKLPAAVLLVDLKKGVSPENLCTPTSENCYVRAEVTIPAAQGNGGTGQVVGLGYCDPNATASPQIGSRPDVTCAMGEPADHYTVNFSCPQGEVGQLYVMPNFYQAAALDQADPSTILTTFKARTDNGLSDATKNTCYADKSGSTNFTCPIAITATFDSESYSVAHPENGVHKGSIGVTYIAYCTTHAISSSQQMIRW